MDKGREVKKVRKKTVRNQLLEQQLRERKSLGTNCCHEKNTTGISISRIKDGLQVSEQLAMVGEDLLFLVQ